MKQQDSQEEQRRLTDQNNISKKESKKKQNYEYSIATEYTKNEQLLGLIVSIIITIYMVLNLAYHFQYFRVYENMKGIRESSWGYYYDKPDFQLMNFYENMPVIMIVSTVFILIGKIVKKLIKDGIFGPQMSFKYQAIFGLILATYIFRGQIIFWLISNNINYFLLQIVRKERQGKTIIWIINFLMLLFIKYDDINGKWLQQSAQLLQPIMGEAILNFSYLCNLQMLYMLSYSLDYIDAYNNRKDETLYKHVESCQNCLKKNYCLTYLSRVSPQIEYFGYINYISYLTYMPLFFSGPISSYNSFANQVIETQKQYSFKQILIYASKIFIIYIVLQIFTILFYFEALETEHENLNFAKEYGLIFQFQQCFFKMGLLYLKFYLIWRTFRTIALLDGVNVIENLPQCFIKGVTAEIFWRNWHTSFNQWIIRYIYIPLGGNRNKFSIVIVFTFVAFWHDLKLDLFLWAWSYCILMIIEKSCVAYFSHKRFTSIKGFKYIVMLASSLDKLLQVYSNSIGFGFGILAFKYINWFSFETFLSNVIFLVYFSLQFMYFAPVLYKKKENSN